jgi:LppX/LprAFG-like lipoprotein
MRKTFAFLAPICLIAFLPMVAVSHAQSGASRQDYLNRAADAMLALKSAQFSLNREGAPAFLDEKNGLTFSAADCTYSAPDRVSCGVKVALKNGSILQITRVWVPEGVFQNNPLTKQFARVPPDSNFNGAALFAKTGIPDILRTAVQKSRIVSRAEKVRGRDTLHITGEVSGNKLNPLIGATLKADLAYPVDLWMEERSSNIVQIHVTEPEGNGWLIALFATNEPVDIPTPQLPAAPAPPRQD